MRTLQEIDKEISKHRRLLHRAVGDRITPRINYHHYEIVSLIQEHDDLFKEQIRNNFTGIKSFSDQLIYELTKLEDKEILQGKFPKAK